MENRKLSKYEDAVTYWHRLDYDDVDLYSLTTVDAYRTPTAQILTQEQLEHTLLPIGDYEKERVREIAKEMGMDVHNKPDSQEICFVKDNDFANFVKTLQIYTKLHKFSF